MLYTILCSSVVFPETSFRHQVVTRVLWPITSGKGIGLSKGKHPSTIGYYRVYKDYNIGVIWG